MKSPIYSQPRRRIVLLQHITSTLTRLYLAMSGSHIKRGIWNVKPNTHYVIASTHQSWFDPFVVATAVGGKRFRQLLPYRFISTPKFLSNELFRPAMIALGCYPSHEYKDYPFGVEASITLLNAGDTIVIFPQGKRTLDKNAEAKRGVSELAKQPSTLVVPVLLHKGRRWFIPSYSVTIGEPFDGSKTTSQEIMDIIYQLD